MDGRRLRWCLYGSLLCLSAGCRTTPSDPFGISKPGQTVGPSAKSSWGGSSQSPSADTPLPISPAEPTAASSKKRKGPPSPEMEVEFANMHIEVALADPPPVNRDELLDLARNRYQRALKQDAKHKGALLGIARMYARTGEQERAKDAFRKYIDAYPKDVEVYHEIAMKHGQWKDWAGAAGWCEAALRLDPENRTYRKTLGFCQARAGRWDDGFATLSKVMPEAQARHNLAGMLDHLGQETACRQQLQMALQADPNYAPAKEFLAELDQPVPPGVPAREPNPVMQAGHTEPR